MKGDKLKFIQKSCVLFYKLGGNIVSSNALAGPEYGIAIVIYLVIMLLVGAYFGKKSKEDKDGFLLAGRELPVIVLVGTRISYVVWRRNRCRRSQFYISNRALGWRFLFHWRALRCIGFNAVSAQNPHYVKIYCPGNFGTEIWHENEILGFDMRSFGIYRNCFV